MAVRPAVTAGSAGPAWWRAPLIAVLALGAIAALLVIGRKGTVDPMTRLGSTVDGRTGSWWFPRGGPYLLGFQSSGPAELLIDGKQVAIGAGVISQRVVFAQGAHAVSFRGPKDARLLWHPPGRRGALEYVPASSLSPLPPDRARFGADAGTSRGSGVVALAILLVAAAAFVALRRPAVDGRALYAAGVVFALALIARALASGAGQTWDEDEYWSSGRNYLVNWLSLDFSDASWRWNMEHPPVTKYVAGLGALFTDGFGAARLLFALLGAASCALAADIGRRLFGSLRAGVLAGVACALTPHLIAHSTIVGHETPSAFFWTLTMWLALRAQGQASGQPLVVHRLAYVGVALGLAVATRFTNLLLAPLVGVTLLVLAVRGRDWRAPLRTALLGLAIVPATAAATFFAVWPRMWSSPVAHLQESWRKLKLPHGGEWYLGDFTREPPWHYFPLYLVVTAPLVLLLAAVLLGGARGVRRRERGWLLLLAWVAAPFGVAWSPVRQDGVRYLLPALVPLAIAAGAGLDWALGYLKDRRAALAGAGAFGLYLTIACARVQPYYLDYYGEHVASPRHRFELGWWGEGIAEAVAYVNRHAAADDAVFRLLEPGHVNWFREDLWRRLATSPAAARWIIVNDAGLDANERTYHRAPFRVPPGFEAAHVVRAQGRALVTVYRRVDAPDSGGGE